MKLELEMQEESAGPEKIPVALEFEKKEICDKLIFIKTAGQFSPGIYLGNVGSMYCTVRCHVEVRDEHD
ncbi:MAG: hypothetical protein K2N24_10915 [Lachnospiraceae bacterium]|nr:hypothetical protein [Lachnospiraceae bacterium]